MCVQHTWHWQVKRVLFSFCNIVLFDFVVSSLFFHCLQNTNTILHFFIFYFLSVFFTEDPCFNQPCGNGTCHTIESNLYYNNPLHFMCNCSSGYLNYENTCQGKVCVEDTMTNRSLKLLFRLFLISRFDRHCWLIQWVNLLLKFNSLFIDEVTSDVNVRQWLLFLAQRYARASFLVQDPCF